MIIVTSYNILVKLKQAKGFKEKPDGLVVQLNRFTVFQGNEWEIRFVDCLLESMKIQTL